MDELDRRVTDHVSCCPHLSVRERLDWAEVTSWHAEVGKNDLLILEAVSFFFFVAW